MWVKNAVLLLVLAAAGACSKAGSSGESDSPTIPYRASARTAEGLALRAETWVVKGAPDTVRTAAIVTNTSQQPVRVEHGSCVLRVRVYATAARSGRPAWDSERRRRKTSVCEDILNIPTLAPGESFPRERFALRISERDLLGDSLRTGNYHFAVSLALIRDTFHLAAGNAYLAP